MHRLDRTRRLSSRTLALALLLAGSPLAACVATDAPPPTATAPPSPAATATAVAATATTTAGRGGASPVTFVRKIETTEVKLLAPSVAVDGQGNVYVLDLSPDNPRVLKYDAQGRLAAQWGGAGGGDGQFNFQTIWAGWVPNGGWVATDRQGNVYVADAFNWRIQKFDAGGTFQLAFGQKGDGDGKFHILGPVYVDDRGLIYVSETDRMQRFSPEGRWLASLSTSGGLDGQFDGPRFLGATDGQGRRYVADENNARIQVLDRDWKFVATWGRKGGGAGQFNRPAGVVIDRQGRLYVTDHSPRIQIFDTAGRFLGQWSIPGNGDPAFKDAAGLAIDAGGDIYVADSKGGVYVFRPK